MALAALYVSAAHGWEGVRTCVGLGLGFYLNAIYKYKVQATRTHRRGLVFIQHGVDAIISLPVALILLVALLKTWHRESPMAHAGSALGAPNVQMSRATASPPPAFHVVEGLDFLTVTSVMGNLELTYTNATGGAVCRPTIEYPQLYPYAFCDVSIQGTSLLDYAFLSFLSYFDKDSADFQALFRPIAAADDWTIREEDSWGMAVDEAAGGMEPLPSGLTGSMPRGRAVEFYSARRNPSVVAVAGTNPLKAYDVFEDILLFHRAFTFEIAEVLSPPLKWIPRQWKSYILSLSSVALELVAKPSPYLYYHHALIQAVNVCKKRQHTHKRVLTGHSLGGWIAQVAAAGSQVPVVAISAPGVYLSSRGFGINHDSLKYIVINVIHENDIVPKLDRLTGAIFTLGCGATNPFICHQPGQRPFASCCAIAGAPRRLASADFLCPRSKGVFGKEGLEAEQKKIEIHFNFSTVFDG